MATLEKLKVGDVLYDVHRTRMGNTTMTIQCEWDVYVKEVNVSDGYAMCSWNGNPPRKYYQHGLKKLRVKPAKKLNGHYRDCAWSHDKFSFKDCTCKDGK
jgi:hypothetical protein